MYSSCCLVSTAALSRPQNRTGRRNQVNVTHFSSARALNAGLTDRTPYTCSVSFSLKRSQSSYTWAGHTCQNLLLEKPRPEIRTHLHQAGRAFLARQREVQVQVGGGRRLAGRSLRLLTLTVAVTVRVGRVQRGCGRNRGNTIQLLPPLVETCKNTLKQNYFSILELIYSHG